MYNFFCKYLLYFRLSTVRIIGFVILALLLGMKLVAKNEDRPNILWLDAEDLSPDLGCYGNEQVYTPNLDKLAEEGILYINAFVTSPVCSPSRSAIITGMYQTTTGTHHHRSHRNDEYKLPKPIKVITEYLRDAGYYTVSCEADNFSRPGKSDYNFQPKVKPFDGTDWRERKPGQPFFAQVHFNEAHRTFKNDPEYPVDPDEVDIPPYYPDHPITRMDWSLYLETIQILDKKVGEVLERLERDGLKENTVIFFTGDHGRAMVRGKQWLYDGGIRIPLIVCWSRHLEPGTRNEELISAIDLAPTWLSIAEAKIPDYLQGRNFLGPHVEREYIFAARDRCDETYDRIRCLRTKRYKYIRNFYPDRTYTQLNRYKKKQYPVLTLMEVLKEKEALEPSQDRFMADKRPPEELYDLEKDPWELHNLANDPEYERILKDLRSKLEEWIFLTNDMGQIPEDPEIGNLYERMAKDNFIKDMNGRGIKPKISNEEYLKWWENKLEELSRGK